MVKTNNSFWIVHSASINLQLLVLVWVWVLLNEVKSCSPKSALQDSFKALISGRLCITVTNPLKNGLLWAAILYS